MSRCDDFRARKGKELMGPARCGHWSSPPPASALFAATGIIRVICPPNWFTESNRRLTRDARSRQKLSCCSQSCGLTAAEEAYGSGSGRPSAASHPPSGWLHTFGGPDVLSKFTDHPQLRGEGGHAAGAARSAAVEASPWGCVGSGLRRAPALGADGLAQDEPRPAGHLGAVHPIACSESPRRQPARPSHRVALVDLDGRPR